MRFDGLIADKAFDAKWIVNGLNESGAKIVILQMPQRKAPLQIDAEVNKRWHLIDNFFCELREFKRSLRAAKTDRCVAAMITLASALINSRWQKAQQALVPGVLA